MYYVAREEKLCYARYEKPLKKNPLEPPLRFVETYSSSNAAAHDPEERVQLHKPRHSANEKEKTSKEDDSLTDKGD